MSYSTIGFHVGIGGNRNGIGDYFRRLDAAGIPAVVKSADDYGACGELLSYDNADHVAIFRMTGGALELPDYTLPPEVAAANHWQRIRAALPPEFDRRTWLEVINEPDKNRAGWLGWFMLHISAHALNDGYRLCGPGWSAGEPEPGDWLSDGWLAYLRRCAENPDRLGVALHEYSFADALTVDGWLVGRFRHLFAACNGQGIPHPTTHITEFGWRHNWVPEPAVAIPQLELVAAHYAQFSSIRSVAIWYLGGGYEGIADRAQRLIAPVTTWMLESPPPEPGPEPPPAETLDEYLWQLSIEEQTERGIWLNPDAGLQKAIFADGLVPVHREVYPVWEGRQVPTMAAEDLSGRRPRRVYVWENGRARWFTEPAGNGGEILPGLRLPGPFRKPFALTSPFNAPRDYGRHEGADYDILGEPADSREPVLAMAAGTVTRSRQAGAYGHHVVVESSHAGQTYRLWYCHMDSRLVEVGDAVTAGQPLGELGATGGDWNEHVHINLEVPGRGLRGYVVDDVVDPAPYITLEPQTGTVDMLPYFVPARDVGDIVILENNWEGGQERQQLQRGADYNVGYTSKNRQWEKWQVASRWVYLLMDTSPGGGEFYTVTGAWCPQHWRPGDEYERTERIQYFRKADCAPSRDPYTMTSRVRFAAFHKTFASPAGVRFADVVELHWLVGDRVEEVRWMAPGLGLVQWQARGGRRSWAVEVIPAADQAPNERERIDCL